MPRTRAAVLSRSSVRGSSSSRLISTMGQPSDWNLILFRPFGAAQARKSRSTAPASTLPCWWSVWLPQISVRPGAEQSTTGRSSSPPKLRANPSSTWATLALAPLISPYLSRDSVPSSSPAPRARRTAPSFCIFILSSFA